MSDHRTCELCEWAHHDLKHGPPTGRYQCRRSPPSITELRRWPQVYGYEWCGEFRSRTPAANPSGS
jgi:hypothetical protein